MERIQATVAEWVDLRPIFDVCSRETGYEGGGKFQVKCCIDVAAENQQKVTAEEIVLEARVWRRKESGKSGESKRGLEGESTDI